MSDRPEFFSWRKAILKSDLPPTTRHVLLTLACHMNDAGESCYPSVKLLCKETGLSNRTVITHLQNAKDLGWIIVGLHGFAGQKWAAHEYFPGWPRNLREAADSLEKAVNEVHQLKKKAVKKIHRVPAEGGEPVAEGGEPVAEGGEPVAKKAVNEVHTSTSLLSTPLSASGSTSENLLAPKKSRASKDKPSNFPLLAEVEKQVISDFLAVRDAKNLPLTETALKGIKREADKLGYTLEQALTVCCERGWAGFKADWILREQAETKAKTPISKEQEKREATERARARVFGVNPTEKDITHEATRL